MKLFAFKSLHWCVSADFDTAREAINTTVLSESAKISDESDAEKIAKYKVKQTKQLIESNIQFDLDKEAEKCLIETAKLNRPCECPEGQRLAKIEWTEKEEPTSPSDASGSTRNENLNTNFLFMEESNY